MTSGPWLLSGILALAYLPQMCLARLTNHLGEGAQIGWILTVAQVDVLAFLAFIPHIFFGVAIAQCGVLLLMAADAPEFTRGEWREREPLRVVS